MKALIAKWLIPSDVTNNLPNVVEWEDGSLASVEDYQRHLGDTHIWIRNPLGLELRVFPEIVADVRYDVLAGIWGLTGAGVEPASLSLTDRNAPDDEIIAELYTFPLIYRVRIHR